MTTFDIEKLWRDADHQADSHYHAITPEIEKRVRATSGSVLQKIRSNSLLEIIVSVLLIALFSLYFRDKPTAVLLLWGIGAVTLLFSLRWYREMDLAIRSVASRSVLESLEAQIKILQAYVARLKWFVYVAIPVAYAAGMTMRFLTADSTAVFFTSGRIWILLMSLPLVGAIIWFARTRYIYWLYEKHVDDLKTLLDTLRE